MSARGKRIVWRWYGQWQPPVFVTTLSLPSASRHAMSALFRYRAGKALVARRHLATHAPLKEKDCTSITPPYHALQDKLALVRTLLDNRPLTLAEKILYSHLADPEKTISSGGLKRGETYLLLHPQVRDCY